MNTNELPLSRKSRNDQAYELLSFMNSYLARTGPIFGNVVANIKPTLLFQAPPMFQFGCQWRPICNPIRRTSPISRQDQRDHNVRGQVFRYKMNHYMP
jgi:hypothetical protein